MATPQDVGSPPSRPLPVPMASSPGSQRGRTIGSPRAVSTARLGSPVPSYSMPGTPQIRQMPGQAGQQSGSLTPLAGATPHSSQPGPGSSALAAALSNSIGGTPPRFGTPPQRPLSATRHLQSSSDVQSNYGSFDRNARSVHGTPGWTTGPPSGYESPEIVRRHLVQPSETSSQIDTQQDGIFGAQSMSYRGDSPAGKSKHNSDDIAPGLDDDEFSSLRLQGGDVTRPIYKWTEAEEASAREQGKRSRSAHTPRPVPEDLAFNIESIKKPGGFRRNYLWRKDASSSDHGGSDVEAGNGTSKNNKPVLFTKSFMEFLTIYGHFAGAELEEDDENLGPNEYYGSDSGEYEAEGNDEDREPMEDSALLAPGLKKKKHKEREKPTSSPLNAALLLLKSFVGTGVLFLPKAYLNGGMWFSNGILLFVAALSYYCFVLLVKTALEVEGSFGDIGGKVYGKWMRNIIHFSIVISQIGFVAAYIIFTSENMQAFILAVSDCKTRISIQWLILIQMAIFLPFSLMRNLARLGFIAFVADTFILVGLVYLYYYDFLTLARNGIADISSFNPKDWTLFIGTAIFTFEGIGLIIPIQESMKEPTKFPKVLGFVMVIITVIFISMGAVSYAAFGSATETVILLNLPQDSKAVNGVQFLYSCAILLSTPLQIFPAIRITETELFTRSGKYNPSIKWQKNLFRFLVVMLCAGVAWFGANDLDKFVSIVGTFACIPLVYIYPPMLHLKALAKGRLRQLADVTLCIFGFCVMVYTTGQTINSWASGNAEPSVPTYCDKKKTDFL